MGWKSALDRYFHVSERGSSVGREVKSGVVSFLTASYILLVNPHILGAAGLPVKAVVAATALSSMLASLLCGLLSNLPVCVSPGMGLNAYLVFSQVLGLGISVEKALAGCFVAAAIVALLASVRALDAILGVVPNSIKLAVVVGMGLLLTFIGLQTSKIVVADPQTMVTMGSLLQLEPALAIGGLAIIASLHYRNVRGSIIVGVLLTALAFFAARGSWPSEFVALPHLRFFALDFSDLFSPAAFNPSAWSAVLAYVLVMVFDIGGAMFGLCNLAGLLHHGPGGGAAGGTAGTAVVPGATWTYLAAAAGTALGAFTGTTPLIIAAESAVGIKEGGRTGLVAVTVAACFGVSMLLAPFLQAIPQLATAPVLVLVGAMMMGEAGHIDWGCMLTAVPAFLTIVIQPFTFSIANGIYAGLVMSALLYLMTGQFLTHLPGSWQGRGDKAGSAAAAGQVGSGSGGVSPSDLERALLAGHGRGGDERRTSGEHYTPGDTTPALHQSQSQGQGQGQGQGQWQGIQGIPIGAGTAAGRAAQVAASMSGAASVEGGASSAGGSGTSYAGTSYERTSYTIYINTAGSGGGSLTARHGSVTPRRRGGGPGSAASHDDAPHPPHH